MKDLRNRELAAIGGGGRGGAQGRSVTGRPGAHQAMQRQGLSRQESPCRCTRRMGQGQGGGYSVAVTVQTLGRCQCYLLVCYSFDPDSAAARCHLPPQGQRQCHPLYGQHENHACKCRLLVDQCFGLGPCPLPPPPPATIGVLYACNCCVPVDWSLTLAPACCHLPPRPMAVSSALWST